MSKPAFEKKQESTQSAVSTLSICDVFKDNTTAVIEKLESQVPVYLQMYSDLEPILKSYPRTIPEGIALPEILPECHLI